MNLLVCFADESKFAKFESSFRNAIVEKNKNKLKSLYLQPDAELE